MPAGDAGPEPTTTEPVETPAGGAADPAPVVPAGDPTPPVTPAEPAPTADPDPFDDEKVQTFDRKYVEGLRREAADRRTAAKELETKLSTLAPKFEGMDADDQEAFLWLVEEYRKDPQAAAEHFLSIGQSLKGEAPTEEDLDQPMTQRQWQEWQAKQSADAESRHLEEQVTVIQKAAVDLGYTVGDPDYVALLYITAEDPKVEGDINKAHELMQARRQAIIDEYVNPKVEKARNGLGTPAPSGVPATQTGGPAKTLEEADARTRARLSAQPGQ